MDQSIIEISGMTKRYGKVEALSGLDLSVQAGQVNGYLGPNGAGKTTTLRILLGLLRADGGRASVFGMDPWKDAVALHQRMSYVPSDVTLWPRLTGGEVIDLLASLRGRTNQARRSELIERFELDPTRKTHTYSRGNKQKVALISALASDSELLVLDEPTSGLDPLMELVFQQSIREAADRGTAVLLSSHILAEVEHLCSQVTIIKAGRTVETGTLQQLRHLTRSHVVLAGDVQLAELQSLPGIEDLRQESGVYRFSLEQQSIPELLQMIAGRSVETFSCTPPSLEELFLHHYQSSGGEL